MFLKIVKIKDFCMDIGGMFGLVWNSMIYFEIYEDILKLKGVLKDMKVSDSNFSKNFGIVIFVVKLKYDLK